MIHSPALAVGWRQRATAVCTSVCRLLLVSAPWLVVGTLPAQSALVWSLELCRYVRLVSVGTVVCSALRLASRGWLRLRFVNPSQARLWCLVLACAAVRVCAQHAEMLYRRTLHFDFFAPVHLLLLLPPAPPPPLFFFFFVPGFVLGPPLGAGPPAPALATVTLTFTTRVSCGSSALATVVTASESQRSACWIAVCHAGGVTCCHTRCMRLGYSAGTACTTSCTVTPRLSNIAVRTADTRSEAADLGQGPARAVL